MKKILLVEDDPTIAMGLSYSLQKEGYGVIEKNSFQSAMATIKESAFDLVLLDVTLPDGSGYDICREIKRNYSTPVIFLTVLGDEPSVVSGLDMGADDYISKPFRLRELLSRVRTVLRRSGEPVLDEIAVGNLTLNLKQARLTKNGEEIPLTALEYRILGVFFQNRAQVLTRNQLLGDIWDIGGEFVNDNTLTVYIKRLREKIEDDPQNPVFLRTVRGLGYKMGD